MSKSDNPRGEIFQDFIASNNLYVCNIGNKFTYECTMGKSIIDVTFVTTPMADRILNWVVHDEDYLSDHKLITYYLTFETPQTVLFRNLKKGQLVPV